MKIRFVMWDWKEQPDLKHLNECLQEVFSGERPCITEVDTGGDQYTVVVSSKVIVEEQAQKIYDRYDSHRNDLPDEEDAYNKVLDIN